MPITWRLATWTDIEPALSIQPTGRGDGFNGVRPALEYWRYFLRDPFFLSAVLEARPAIQGHRIIGLAAAVMVSREFMDAEISHPRPDVTARIMASIRSNQPVLAAWNEVAAANAGVGVEVVALYCMWRDQILAPAERNEVQTLFASSLAEVLAGFRIRRILTETTVELVTEFHRRSVVYRTIAEFPELRRVIHLMTSESVQAMPASLGNVIFQYNEPLLRLRDSDQQLLLAALSGATDQEVSARLGLTSSAVKARWRSTFARIAEVMPHLVSDEADHEGRGAQKRHRILAYLRTHMEELRPYDWKIGSRDAETKKTAGAGFECP